MQAPRKATLHRIPWEIDHNGPAKVSTYFQPAPLVEGVLVFKYYEQWAHYRVRVSFSGRKDQSPPKFTPLLFAGDKVLKASFQGRGLRGEELTMPEGYTGVRLLARAARHLPPDARETREARHRGEEVPP